ncbi:MAG: DUF4340 domain-containing protein [Magnetococcales bacterium]|nr:DUF4340 domain-containing protein [Magnetococcales bacterium]
MEKIIRILAVVLVIQVILVGATAFMGPNLDTLPPDQALVTFKAADVNEVSIESGDGGKVSLAKKDGKWILPEQKGFPASSDMVQGLLDTLSTIKHGLPVATSAAAQARFKVADKEFERKIVLSQTGGKQSVLYFGTSPGLRQVHARPEGSEATLSVAFANHQAPAKVDDWLDKTLLSTPEDDIAAIEVNGLTITRVGTPPAADDKNDKDVKKSENKEPQWQIQPLTGGETAKPEELARLVRMVAHLTFDGLAENGTEAKGAIDQAQWRLVVKKNKGDPVTIKLAKMEKGDNYLLQSSARDEILRIPVYTGDLLLKTASKEVLVASPAKAEAGKETALKPPHSPVVGPAESMAPPLANQPDTAVPTPKDAAAEQPAVPSTENGAGMKTAPH